MAISHQLIKTTNYRSGITVTTIQREETVVVFNQDQDNGYHPYGRHWWTNPECPNAFKYLSLDAMYPPVYFADGGGHPPEETSRIIYDYMQEMYTRLFGKPFNSILELGTGGGEITTQFVKHQRDYHAVEGTVGGVDKMVQLGVDPNRITHCNLKLLPDLGRRFDLVMCTEVAEHIEPWFASKVVLNCITHANAVWFSAFPGAERDHYHHSNEVPIEAWDNIFAFYGFNNYVQLDGRFSRADRIYLNDEALGNII